jgi:hypothetical protein
LPANWSSIPVTKLGPVTLADKQGMADNLEWEFLRCLMGMGFGVNVAVREAAPMQLMEKMVSNVYLIQELNVSFGWAALLWLVC